MSNTKDWNDSDFHLPYNRHLVEKAKELRKNMTPAERKLWYGYLKTFKFRVLRFTNDEVLQDWEGVCRRIEESIPPTPLKKGG